MKYVKKIGVLTAGILLVFACKKNNSASSSADTVSSQNIHGQVYNLCTDSGLVNCTVYLQENGNTIAQMQSGVNGAFTFSNVSIHSSSDYNYTIQTIDNPDGGGLTPPIDGGTAIISKENYAQIYTVNILAKFNQLYLYLPVKSRNTMDTVVVTLQQNVFHKNVPGGNYNLIYNFTLPLPPPPLGYNTGELDDVSSKYWMGWWNIKTDRIERGVHITKTDSIYIGWGAAVTDTIPW
ncbi:MAG: hypothetical protein JST67_03775 [Bacteroidetes bacterium]|nr:hypothetical protein [Bacteroidota bacterium]